MGAINSVLAAASGEDAYGAGAAAGSGMAMGMAPAFGQPGTGA